MQDKEVFTFMTLIREILEKGDVELALSILNEKTKKLGLKICEQKIMMPQAQQIAVKQ